ncbi:hypothetical protein HC251_13365 [Iamia sp. SCSIO 61187]|uniref:glycosyltransferase family 39 protein n=1 Tax=Iamia sp. SCSIO 61187 TaxID=2722752 RepID=UPI001C627A4D|nr:glycosyltransferase family 39 protein [Iamia sp. SCSIO 61187]QYG93315.1 hypothetical protein HC251_13365 [Iamia sp. SCSIO 61187]
MDARVVGRLVVGLLAVVFTVSGLRQAWADSPTVDEGVGLASGLSYWVHGDLRMSPEHPVLPKLVSAAPALAAGPIVPKGTDWDDGDWFDHTDAVLAANDAEGDLRRVVFLSRLVPLALALVAGLLVHHLARRLAGDGAGLVAAGAWLTTPVVLGLGAVQSIDIAFTVATLAVVAALVRHHDRPDLRSAALVGVVLAVALVTRHSALVLVPVALVAVAVSCPGDRAARLRHVGVAGLVGWVGLWLVYRGFDPASPGGAPGERFDALVAAAGDRSVLARLALIVPAPQEWRVGLGHLTVTSDPRPAWLLGRAWEGSRWWYFPGALVATVPFPVLGLLVAGPLGWVAGPREQRRPLALVALPGLALFAFTALQPLNLGLRLAMPSLALWLVVAAAGAGHAVCAARARWPGAVVPGRILLALVALVQAGVLLSASSHALAWRPLAFRPGYRWVSDSNIDFGQDLWRVRDWAEGRDDPWVAVISPRGLAPGPGTRRLVGADLDEVTGWLAVGVTSLTVVNRDDLAWLRAYCPVGTLGGGSTLVYRLREPPSAAPGPERPVAPCEDEEFSVRR